MAITIGALSPETSVWWNRISRPDEPCRESGVISKVIIEGAADRRREGYRVHVVEGRRGRLREDVYRLWSGGRRLPTSR